MAVELADTLAARHDGALGEFQELSLDQLTADGYPLARPLLRMLSLAVDAPLARSLITPELLQPVVDSQVTGAAMDGALAGLHRHGLILTVPDAPCVTLHHLVREINALLLAEKSATRQWQDTLDWILLADAKETAGSGRTGWVHVRHLAPHLVPIIGRRPVHDVLHRVLEALDDATHAATELLPRCGDLADALRDLGEYRRAADLVRQALHRGPPMQQARRRRSRIVKRSASARSTWPFSRRFNEDEYVHASGYRQAADLFGQVLTARERVLGSDHPDTLRSRNNLAVAVANLGHSWEAAELHLQTFSDSKRVLGSRHPTTLLSRYNIDMMLREQRHLLEEVRQGQR